MAQSIILHALTEKRAEVSGRIAELEERTRQARADLAHIDATLLLFDPDAKPAAIRARRQSPKNRDGLFAEGEVSRRCRDFLRTAKEPASADTIVRHTMADKGLDVEDSRLRQGLLGRFLMALHRLHRAGEVRKIGHGLGTRWTLSEGAEGD